MRETKFRGKRKDIGGFEMSIFKCEECGCAENTALCRYNYREKGEKALCSECDPKIAKWHGCFKKVKFKEEDLK